VAQQLSAKQQIKKAKADLILQTLKSNLRAAGMQPVWVDYLTPEYRFARNMGRQWAADFALPHLYLLIEVEGGIWKYGRHNRAEGFIADMEKYNAAAQLGYVLLRYLPSEIVTQRAAQQILQTALAIDTKLGQV